MENMKNPDVPERKPRVEKVVVGTVVQQRKPLRRRFLDTFIAEEADGVGRYIIFDVLVPAFKDVIADVVSQGIERILFGRARSTSRRTGSYPSNGYVTYNRYSTSSARDRREDPRAAEREVRRPHDFEEIVLKSRGEANEVINQLFNLVEKYGQATVLDLMDLVGLSGNFTDEKYGWVDLRGAGVTRVTNGYLLDLPRPGVLD